MDAPVPRPLRLRMQETRRFGAGPFAPWRLRQRTLRNLLSQRVKSAPLKHCTNHLLRMLTSQFIRFLHTRGGQSVCDQAIQTQCF